jgi:hypothetical protein
VLLNVIAGVATSAGAVFASHIIGLVLTLVSLSVTIGYLIYVALGPVSRGWGPVLLCVFASPLILANSVVNILEDNGTITGNTKYLDQLTYTFTWIGMAQLICATLWNAGIDIKLQKRFGARLKCCKTSSRYQPCS